MSFERSRETCYNYYRYFAIDNIGFLMTTEDISGNIGFRVYETELF